MNSISLLLLLFLNENCWISPSFLDIVEISVIPPPNNCLIVSIGIIKPWIKESWRGEGLFHLHILSHSPLRKAKAGNSKGKKPREKS